MSLITAALPRAEKIKSNTCLKTIGTPQQPYISTKGYTYDP